VNPYDTGPGLAATNRPVAVFAAATAALVTSDDTLGIIISLLRDATSVLAAAGAGLVVTSATGDLELLASISHRAEELELFQLQADAGPCVDASRTGNTVISSSAQETTSRWPALSSAFAAAGFAALHATPMRWHGQTLGAVNFFWNSDHDTGPDSALIRGYTDVATIAVVHAGHVTATQLRERTRAALTSRHLIEQAKGVLAYRDHIDMQTAYTRLLQIAERDRVAVSAAASQIIEEAQMPPAGH
jgi:hypothetical protein